MVGVSRGAQDIYLARGKALANSNSAVVGEPSITRHILDVRGVAGLVQVVQVLGAGADKGLAGRLRCCLAVLLSNANLQASDEQ
jgi:hypothetical protein